MMYKEKIEGLLETLYSKLRSLERISVGTLRVTSNEATNITLEAQRIVERIAELVRLER
jgi:hypothetical protein